MHRILVVDDAADCAEPLRRLLRLSGFDVAVAANGAEGLDRLAGFAPEVVILDLNMPVLDGYGFLDALHDRPERDHVRVIVFTADHEADAARLRSLGATKVCRKAYTPFTALLAEVGDCLRA